MKIELNEELRALNEARHDQKLSLADFRAHRRKIIENLKMNRLDVDNFFDQNVVQDLKLTKEKQSPVAMIVLFSIITVIIVWLVNLTL